MRIKHDQFEIQPFKAFYKYKKASTNANRQIERLRKIHMCFCLVKTCRLIICRVVTRCECNRE